MTYKYCTEDNLIFGVFESTWEDDEPQHFDLIAEDAAEYELSQSGEYWEQNESRQFQIFRMDGYTLGIFNVKCEYLPNFRASEEEVKI